MNPAKLLEFFDVRKARDEALVLVTVIGTEGSTYSKPGAQMLVDASGVFRGMLSGGCLEGDLAIRAQQVLDSGKAQVAEYDLGQDDDELWGMGVGCDGLMRMVLQPIRPQNGYAPFDRIARVWNSDAAEEITMQVDVDGIGEITIHVEPTPRVLILGAGLDAEPVVRFAVELGWRCTICDHRPAYIESGDFTGAVATHSFPAAELGESLDLGKFDAAIVMSHHLVTDRTYLAQLANTPIPYIGLLGPVHRRTRLLDELGEEGAALDDRLHGPAGLDIGGRGPAPIALSIVAEVQKVLAGR